MFERASCMQRARDAYVRSALGCPANLRWKVWLAGARSELGFGREDNARKLLDRAQREVRGPMGWLGLGFHPYLSMCVVVSLRVCCAASLSWVCVVLCGCAATRTNVLNLG
jgi:hypothetical protein